MGAELLFSIPILLVGVFKVKVTAIAMSSPTVASGDVMVFRI